MGLIDDEGVIAEYLLNIPVTHSERLLGAIELVLKEARAAIGDLDGWAISLGPGSFTGLRIGVSTVKGLAFATRKPVVGVSTLDVLASQISPTPYLICPILDARKKEVYTAFYRYEEGNSPKRLSAYQAIRPEDLVKRIERKNDLHRRWRKNLRRLSPKRSSHPSPFSHPFRSISLMGQSWPNWDLNFFEKENIWTYQPLLLSMSDLQKLKSSGKKPIRIDKPSYYINLFYQLKFQFVVGKLRPVTSVS